MDEIPKWKRWRRFEVEAMLNIIKEWKIIDLMDGKVKRNKEIYSLIESELKKQSIYKTIDQIKTKFKMCKADYYKTKSHNNISGNDRRDCEHYELLHELLQTRPLASLNGVDTALEYDEGYNYIEIEPLSSFSQEKALFSSEPASSSESASFSESAPSLQPVQSVSETESSPQQGTSSRRVFKKAEKRSYQKAIAAFTDEWKNIQNDVMEKIKERDIDLVDRLEKNDDANYQRLALLLEKEREQTAKTIKEIFSSFSS